MTETRLLQASPGRWMLSGTLDFTTVSRLAAEGGALLRDAAAGGAGSLEVDLSGVGTANSAGLALLLEWMELAQALGICLTYRHLPASLARIAAVSNLRHLMPVAD